MLSTTQNKIKRDFSSRGVACLGACWEASLAEFFPQGFPAVRLSQIGSFITSQGNQTQWRID